jgi:hypothetical protein
MTVIFPITGSLLPSVTKPVTEFYKPMQQKKKDKKVSALIWLNFIDLWCQNTIYFTINKKGLFFNYH